MDFVADNLFNGGKIRALTVVDNFSRECLHNHWFLSLDDARKEIETWRTDYNTFRSHSSLENMTPEEYRTKHREAGIL